MLPSCADSRCRSAPRADGACREKQPVPGPRRETQPRGTTRLVTPETGRDRGRRGHVVRTRALAECVSSGRARTGAAEQREAAERDREGARHGASEHDAAASPARRRAPGGAEASCGGPGSDEVSGQPGAASPWGRPRVPDPRPGPGFRGLRRAGRGEIGGVSGPTRGWRAVQTADHRGPSQGRREAWPTESDASLAAAAPARRGANSAAARGRPRSARRTATRAHQALGEGSLGLPRLLERDTGRTGPRDTATRPRLGSVSDLTT